MSRFQRMFSSPIGLILMGVAVPFVVAVVAILISLDTSGDYALVGLYRFFMLLTVGAATGLGLVALGVRWTRATARPRYFAKFAAANVVLLCSASILLMFVPLSQVTTVTCSMFAPDDVDPCSESAPQLFSVHDLYLWVDARNEQSYWHDAPSRSISTGGLVSRYWLLLVGLNVLSVTLVPWWVARHERATKTSG